MRRLALAFACALTAVSALAPAAFAQEDKKKLLPLDELRLGIYDHDISLGGHGKESGVDTGLEFVFASPDILSVIYSPRPVLGFLINSRNTTDQAYFGLTYRFDVLKEILNSRDGFYIEATLGGALHTGKLDVTDPQESQRRKSLGSEILFREDLDIGYQINETFSIALSYNHISNADLAKRNEGINDLGVRFGYHF